MSQMCACGCGQPVKPGRRFLHGYSGHKFSPESGRAAKARVRSRRVEVVDLFPEDVAELVRLLALTSD